MNDPTDPIEGVAAELGLKGGRDREMADFIITAPPPAYAVPVEFAGEMRGRIVTVATFPARNAPAVHQRGLRGWSEPYRAAVNSVPADPFLWRVDVVTEESWWRHRFTGAPPNWVESFPACMTWVEEEPATEHVTPWPVQ